MLRESKKQDKSSHCSFPPCLHVNLIVVFQSAGHHTELNSRPHQKSHFTYTTQFLETRTAALSFHMTLRWRGSAILPAARPQSSVSHLYPARGRILPTRSHILHSRCTEAYPHTAWSQLRSVKKKKRQKTMRMGKREGVQTQHRFLHRELMFAPSQARPQEAAACEQQFPFPSLQNSCFVA